MMFWMFGKGKERISLGRRPESCALVVVRSRDRVSEYHFPDVPSLQVFQADMEAFLRKTGWSLLQYAPERRRRDRDQGVPQLEERRRWWTDTKERAKVVWGDKSAQA